MKTMASGPITSRQTDGEAVETATDFIFMGSKIIMDGDCSHEIKKHLLPERRAMMNPESVKKQRHQLLTKVRVAKAFFLAVMHTCGSWAVKKGEG